MDRRRALLLTLVVGVAGLSGLTGMARAQDARALLETNCGACHLERPDGQLDRIAEARKTPEAWSMTVIRMMVVHGVQLGAAERRSLVKYLSDTKGLAPSESEGYRYILERTPGVMDTGPTEELSAMCGRCHSFARVALQRRTREDWLKLMHFHLGQYPTTEYQALGRDRDWWTIATTTVVDELARSQPLETEAWTAWKDTASPDLSGAWRFAGRRPGAGAYHGTATLTARGADEYDAVVETVLADGTTARAEGRATVYAAHEVRFSVTTADGVAQRAVLSTGGDPGAMTGRWFERDNDVIGGSVNAVRGDGGPRILSLSPGHLKAGTTAEVTIAGVGLDGDVDAGDGVDVDIVSRTPELIVATLTASDDTGLGARDVRVGDTRLTDGLVVYDAIAAVSVEPARTIARVGGNGGPIPPMPAQFEAIGFMAGDDGQPGTDDDVRVGVVDASWSVDNFDETAAGLKDAEFAGTISGDGLFSPAGAGPNPARPMSTNNAGNLKVIATVDDGGAPVTGEAHLFVTVQRFVDAPIR